MSKALSGELSCTRTGLAIEHYYILPNNVLMLDLFPGNEMMPLLRVI